MTCKSILRSFKKNHGDKNYPIGANIMPSDETRIYVPYLANRDFEICATELFEVCDYLVLNFFGPESDLIGHLLEPKEMKKLIGSI